MGTLSSMLYTSHPHTHTHTHTHILGHQNHAHPVRSQWWSSPLGYRCQSHTRIVFKSNDPQQKLCHRQCALNTWHDGAYVCLYRVVTLDYTGTNERFRLVSVFDMNTIRMKVLHSGVYCVSSIANSVLSLTNIALWLSSLSNVFIVGNSTTINTGY